MSKISSITSANPTLLTLLRAGAEITFQQDEVALAGWPASKDISVQEYDGVAFRHTGTWPLTPEGLEDAVRDAKEIAREHKRKAEEAW